jgi:hypothetical protein
LTIHRWIAGKPKKTSNVASDKKLMLEGEDLPLSLSARWQLKGCECAPRTAPDIRHALDPVRLALSELE